MGSDVSGHRDDRSAEPDLSRAPDASGRDADDGEQVSGWDEPGVLSIVVQGSVYHSNIVQTALHCAHWRQICPGAEIILAVATTDILVVGRGQSEGARSIELVRHHRQEGILQAAVSRLTVACDRIVLSEGALPLPPLKFDKKPNNVNLQIAAAKAGLAVATGKHTLRIRSDIVFLDGSFRDFYDDHRSVPRKTSFAFKQRVMISPYFTLNPFTIERFSFHLSDWFHFGLTDDVRSIWAAVPEMSLADALHHEFHRHHPDANFIERKFKVRKAIEQHIHTAMLAARWPDVVRGHLTDATFAQRSIEVLLGDYLICDVDRVPIVFEKYAKTFRDPNMELRCITYDQWCELNAMPEGTEFRHVYSEATRRARRWIRMREAPALRPIHFLLIAARFIRGQLGWPVPKRVPSLPTSRRRVDRPSSAKPVAGGDGPGLSASPLRRWFGRV